MTTPPIIHANDLDGVAALRAASSTAMCKRKGERDTEFVKRIVAAYLNACAEINILMSSRDGIH